MTMLELASTFLSLLALAIASLSLVLVFAWRKTTPEIGDLRTKFIALSMGQTDIMDRLTQWMQRDDARNARKGKKKKHDDEEYEEVIIEPPKPQSIAERKVELRKRLVHGRVA